MANRVAKLSPTVILMADARGRRKADDIASPTCPGEHYPLERMWSPSVGYLVSHNFIKLEQPDVENIVEALR
jgi:hypothetical protein